MYPNVRLVLYTIISTELRLARTLIPMYLLCCKYFFSAAAKIGLQRWRIPIAIIYLARYCGASQVPTHSHGIREIPHLIVTTLRYFHCSDRSFIPH